VALTAVDVFSGVIAAFPRHLRGLDTLCIQAANVGMLMTFSVLPNLSAERIMDTLPDAIVPPCPEIPIDTGPVGEVMGEHPPLNSTHGHVENRVDNLAHIQCTMSPPWLGWRAHIFDQIPLFVREISLIRDGFHPSPEPDPS
jgi:hypothetical protein